MTLLETRGVSRYFGGLGAVVEVDFSLEPHQIHALIGPNGAGKTTFVSLLCGRLSCTTGTILFDGENITSLPAWRRVRRGIAYTFQITRIYPRLTVQENLAIAVEGQGRRGRVRSHRVADILQHINLQERSDDLAGHLAYGHQRLLEVGMGLALEPRLLILDEPAQGLSRREIDQCCTLIRDLARDAAVLLIEHNMPVVMELADRITVFDHGRVLAQGTPKDIQADPAVQAAYLGTGEA